MNQLDHLQQYKQKKILIAPLNWGLGHATRCVPIINFLKIDNEVMLASDGLSLNWLSQEYPDLTTVELPPYEISYDSEHMWLNMLKSSPQLISAVRGEHQLLQDLVREEGIDLVISDHRLGLYTSLCQCVVIAHQITIPHVNLILRGMISNINKGYLNRYNEVWIADYKDRSKSLAGNISSSSGLNKYRYIGPLSRLQKENVETDIEILIMLSGPEPSRTSLEDELIQIIAQRQMEISVTIIRGTVEPLKKSGQLQNVEIIDLADTAILNDRINRAKLIICRAGYSSIMDLHQLDKRAILIPTPSQPEQEYLGQYHKEKRNHQVILQSDISAGLI